MNKNQLWTIAGIVTALITLWSIVDFAIHGY